MRVLPRTGGEPLPETDVGGWPLDNLFGSVALDLADLTFHAERIHTRCFAFKYWSGRILCSVLRGCNRGLLSRTGLAARRCSRGCTRGFEPTIQTTGNQLSGPEAGDAGDVQARLEQRALLATESLRAVDSKVRSRQGKHCGTRWWEGHRTDRRDRCRPTQPGRQILEPTVIAFDPVVQVVAPVVRQLVVDGVTDDAAPVPVPRRGLVKHPLQILASLGQHR